MFAHSARFAVLAILVTAASVQNGFAYQFNPLADISATLGNNAGRLCTSAYGVSNTASIGCPTYAPSLTTAGDVSVTGALQATQFIGSGAGLTNIPASAVSGLSGDRITSSTHGAVVNGTTGYISLTTDTSAPGTYWGYLSGNWSLLPNLFATGVVSASQVSATNVSATTAHFSGNVGIGTTAPTARLEVKGNNGTIQLANSGDTITFSKAGTNYFYAGNAAGAFSFQTAGSNDRLLISNNGNVGIGTTAPVGILDVSGSNASTHGIIARYNAVSGNSKYPLSVVNDAGFTSMAVGANQTVNEGTLFLNAPTGQGNGAGVTFTSNGGVNTGVFQLDAAGNMVFRPLVGHLFFDSPGAGTTYFRNGASYVTTMHLTATNRVGIGTTSPLAPLQVSGTTLITSWTGINMARLAVAPLEVSGTVSATRFVGDGSLLSGINIQSDRITSSTHGAVVNGTTGYISLTTDTSAPGTYWGYLSGNWSLLPNLFATGVVSASQVSATNVSATTAHFSGNVGIGTTAATKSLQISSTQPEIRLEGGSSAWPLISFNNSSGALITGMNNSGDYGLWYSGQSFGQQVVIKNSTKYMDGGTTAPAATLQVSGTFIVSNSAQSTTPSLYVGSNGNVGIGTTAPNSILTISSTSPVLQVGSTANNNSTLMLDEGAGFGGYLRSYGNTNRMTLGSTSGGGDRDDLSIDRATGNVGIGTTAPSTTLTVSGSQLNTSWTAINMNRLAVTPLEVSGTVSATRFVGDGSLLSGINIQSDRITSSTHGAVVNGTTGYISLTTDTSAPGTYWGYLSGNWSLLPNLFATGVVSASQVSATNVSATTAHFTNRVGVGTTNPLGQIHAYFNSTNTTTPQINIEQAGSGNPFLQFIATGIRAWTVGLDHADSDKFKISSANDSFASTKLTIATTGNVGIGTTAPTATLQVSGSFIVSNSAQSTTPTLYASGSKLGINTSSPFSQLHIAGNGATGTYARFDDQTTSRKADIGLVDGFNSIISQSAGNFQVKIGMSNAFGVNVGPGYNSSFYLPNGGGVMIGNSSYPSSTLHVSGTTRITSWTTIAANVTPTAELDVYGKVSATSLTVNGVAVTGNTAITDRISSTDNQALVIANPGMGTVSFTLGGTAQSAYFYPNLGLVTQGISTTTNQASFTTVYASGNVGIGTTAPGQKLEVYNGFIQISHNQPYLYFNDLDNATRNSISLSFGAFYIGGDPTASSLIFRNKAAWGESMRVDASGNVGIGTTAPTATLQVSGTFIVSNSAQNTTPSLYVGSNGNVGIGTNNPSARLQIDNTNSSVGSAIVVKGYASGDVAQGGQIQMVNTSAGATNANKYLRVDQTGSFQILNNAYSGVVFAMADNGNQYMSPASPATSGTNYSSPQFSYYGKYWNGSASAVDSFNIQNVLAAGANPATTLQFSHSGSTGAAQYVFLNGNVGIGTTSPQAKLDVAGTISATGISTTGIISASYFEGDGSRLTGLASGDRITSSTHGAVVNGTTGYISLTTDTSAPGTYWGYLSGNWSLLPNLFATGVVSASQISATNVSATTAHFSGNVGIGTTAPSVALDVNGTVRANILIIPGYGQIRPMSGGLGLWGSNNGVYFTDSSQTNTYMMVKSGLVGIGTTTPAATLQVSGSFIVSQTGQTTNPSLYVSATNGYVGIGTTSPQRRLQIGEYSGVNELSIASGATGSGAVVFGKGTGNSGNDVWRGAVKYDHLTDYMYLITANSLRMAIGSTGNVGISTTAPIAKLDVNGTISASDIIQVGSTTTIACTNNSNNGSIRYNNVSDTLQICTGSGWKSLVSSSALAAGTATGVEDHIVSGTTSIYANTATNTISFTTAGSVANYVDNGGRFVMTGISATTNQTSVTSLYASGNVGIGTAPTSSLLDVAIPSSGVVYLGQGGVASGVQFTNGLISSNNSLFRLRASPRTGAYVPLTLETSNTEYVRLTTAGLLGVGTTAPAATLQISGTFIVSTTGQNTTPTLYAGTNGYVGVGTSNPSNQLYVESSNPTIATFARSSTANAALEFKNSNGSMFVGASDVTADFSIGSGNALTANSYFMVKRTSGNVGIGTINPKTKLHIADTAIPTTIPALGAYTNAEFYMSNNDNTYGLLGGSLASGNTWLQVQRTDGTATAYNMLLQPNGGNVGIGTSSPGNTLEVKSTEDTNGIRIGNGPGYAFDIGRKSTTGALTIQGSQTGYNNIVLAPTSGNVGIGTTNPTQKLDVRGMGIFANTDYAAASAGSGVGIYQTAGSGNTSSNIQAFQSGYNSGANLNLNPWQGNVGIGTIAPSEPLTVVAANQADGLNGSNIGFYTNDTAAINKGSSLNLGGTYDTASAAQLGFGRVSGRKENSTSGDWSGYLQFSTRRYGAGFDERMRITSAGNVGIGTTGPNYPLDVVGNANVSGQLSAGQIICSTATNCYLSASGASAQLVLQTNALNRLVIANNGTITFGAYGAGTLTTNASGVITASSDERLKNIQGSFSRGIDELVGLAPISYRWKPSSGNDDGHVYSGFSAQNVQKVIPEAVGVDSKGYLTLSDRPILAVAVNSIKQLKAANDALVSRTTALEAKLKAANDNHAADMKALADFRRELDEFKRVQR